MSKKIISSKKKDSIASRRYISESVLLLFPLFMIVTLLPLIVKMHAFHSGLNIYDWFSVNDIAYDFFLFYKQWIFVGICGLIVLIIAGRALYDRKTLKFHKIYIPLLVYTVLTVIATMVSEYRYFGILGNMDQFENIFCIIGYALVAYYCFLVIESEQEVKLLIHAFAIGALILGVIGIFQSFGLDFFATDFGKSLIVQEGFDPNSLSFSFGPRRVYGTVYNPNYVGVYTVMTISLYSVLFIFAKKTYEYILYYLVIFTSAFSMFGSQFKAGLVYLAVTLFMIAIALRKQLIERWYFGLTIIATLVIAFFTTNYTGGGAYQSAIEAALQNTSNASPDLISIDTSDENVLVNYKGNKFTASLDQNQEIVIKDQNGTSITYTKLEELDGCITYTIDDMRFEDIIVAIYTDDEEELDFCFFENERYWAFQYNEEKQTYLYYNRYGQFSPIITADTAIFDGHERFASGRGYIWSRTIPLLSKYFFLGSGADSFVQAFPQYDYVGMTNFGYGEQLITKPHCLYLQIGVHSGVVGLVCFLLFFLLYAIYSIKLYLNHNFQTRISQIGVAIFIGIVGFLLSGISNDSSIGVSPVFWVLVGLGIVCNRMVKEGLSK